VVSGCAQVRWFCVEGDLDELVCSALWPLDTLVWRYAECE